MLFAWEQNWLWECKVWIGCKIVFIEQPISVSLAKHEYLLNLVTPMVNRLFQDLYQLLLVPKETRKLILNFKYKDIANCFTRPKCYHKNSISSTLETAKFIQTIIFVYYLKLWLPLKTILQCMWTCGRKNWCLHLF